MPAPAGQSCASCLYFCVGILSNRDACHRYPPADKGQQGFWPFVLPDEWCGDYKAADGGGGEGETAAAVYLSGSQVLTDATRKKLLDVGGDPVLTAAAVTGCQLSNPTGQLEIFIFYDGDDPNKILTQIGCAQNTSYQFQFTPAPLVAWSGEVWVSLKDANPGVMVSAQGFKKKPN